jgi:hypothetical protein
MNKLLLALAALLCCATAHATNAGVLYSEPDDGLFILRNPALAQTLHESDRACESYAKSQEKAESAAAEAAAHPAKKTLQRQKAGMASAANHLMGQCLEADKAAKRALVKVLGPNTLDRLQKAAAFEDMVYVQLLPDADHFEALK